MRAALPLASGAALPRAWALASAVACVLGAAACGGDGTGPARVPINGHWVAFVPSACGGAVTGGDRYDVTLEEAGDVLTGTTVRTRCGIAGPAQPIEGVVRWPRVSFTAAPVAGQASEIGFDGEYEYARNQLVGREVVAGSDTAERTYTRR